MKFSDIIFWKLEFVNTEGKFLIMFITPYLFSLIGEWMGYFQAKEKMRGEIIKNHRSDEKEESIKARL